MPGLNRVFFTFPRPKNRLRSGERIANEGTRRTFSFFQLSGSQLEICDGVGGGGFHFISGANFLNDLILCKTRKKVACENPTRSN
jgi:hypothetical protein